MSLREQVGHVIIVDNGSRASEILNQVEQSQWDNIIVHRLSDNMGVACALNIGIIIAKSNHAQYVLLCDQDSSFPDDYVARMVNFSRIQHQSGIKVGLVAPNFRDRNSGTYARFTHLTRFTLRFQTCHAGMTSLLTSFAITSGSILAISVLDQVGPFDEALFIDHVDSEYCLRLQSRGFHTVINCQECIDHAVGHRSVHKHLGFVLKPNNHNAVRRYYISRNGLHITKKYFWAYPSFAILNLLRIAHEIACVALHEENKIKKLTMILVGAKDAMIGKLGKWIG